MGTWGPGNFQDDGALDYVSDLMDTWTGQLQATVEECFADNSRSALDEEGEAVIVPSVAVMVTLCEHCHAKPPRLEVASRWKQQYLSLYDEQIDDREPTPDFKVQRRRTIEETFGKLEEQAQKHWAFVSAK